MKIKFLNNNLIKQCEETWNLRLDHSYFSGLFFKKNIKKGFKTHLRQLSKQAFKSMAINQILFPHCPEEPALITWPDVSIPYRKTLLNALHCVTLKKKLQNKVITRILSILEVKEIVEQPACTNACRFFENDNKAPVSHLVKNSSLLSGVPNGKQEFDIVTIILPSFALSFRSVRMHLSPTANETR